MWRGRVDESWGGRVSPLQQASCGRGGTRRADAGRRAADALRPSGRACGQVGRPRPGARPSRRPGQLQQPLRSPAQCERFTRYRRTWPKTAPELQFRRSVRPCERSSCLPTCQLSPSVGAKRSAVQRSQDGPSIRVEYLSVIVVSVNSATPPQAPLHPRHEKHQVSEIHDSIQPANFSFIKYRPSVKIHPAKTFQLGPQTRQNRSRRTLKRRLQSGPYDEHLNSAAEIIYFTADDTLNWTFLSFDTL